MSPPTDAVEKREPRETGESREWVSFDDPDDRRTWIFDVTFLESSWTCIYGNGCQGIESTLTPERAHGCCSLGAAMTNADDFLTVSRATDRLRADQWQHRSAAARRGAYKKNRDGMLATRVVDGACIFLNRPGFPGGPGCALHRGALEAGERPLDWKPYVCWQIPLRRDDSVDMYGHATSIVRAWLRRDWGPGGSELAWWCPEEPAAHVGAVPVWRSLRDELTEIAGPDIYDRLSAYLAGRANNTSNNTTDTNTTDHAAVRLGAGTTTPVATPTRRPPKSPSPRPPRRPC